MTVQDNSKRHKTGQQIQSAILKYVRERCKGFIVAYKVEIANERGVPDLLLCVRGKFVAAEIKGHGDRVTPIQLAQMKRIENAGGKARVIDSLDDFKRFIDEC